MYKVFINEKPVILSNKVHIADPKGNDLVYDYTDRCDLEQLIHRFSENDTNEKLIIINRKNPDLLYETFLSLFKPICAAGGIVYHKKKGMLWILRHNRWDLPKGKIDAGENKEEAAIREVEEETGLRQLRISAPLGATRHAYWEKNRLTLKTSFWYSMQTHDPDQMLVPQLNEGITKVEWAGQDTIAEKIGETYASLKELAREFVISHTNWQLPAID